MGDQTYDADWIVVGSGSGGSEAALRWRTLGVIRFDTRQDPTHPNPTFIREGFEATRWLALATGGLARRKPTEATARIPTTAHIRGGAAVGVDAASSVIDSERCREAPWSPRSGVPCRDRLSAPDRLLRRPRTARDCSG